MKKAFLLAASLWMLVSLSFAEPVGRQDALNNVRAFLSDRGISLIHPEAAYKAPRRKSKSGMEESSFYIFNIGADKGFVIASGDNRTEPILGYVEHGSFSEEEMPENMRSWLQYYADQIEYLDEIGYTTSQESPRVRRIRPTRHSVAPLLKTKWNQDAPYNLKCPMFYYSDGSVGERAATGCVATAVAQCINYYKYPEKTTAIIPKLTNYYSLTNGSRKSVSLPAIARRTIDWEHMRDTYTGNETEEEKNAVADLMLMVGQSEQMGYGSSSGVVFGSGIAEALIKYFGYDDGTFMADRNDYSIDGWFNLIYQEIATGHPVAMAGTSSGGAHSFVLDGFDGESLFHLNWGWGGMNDGYFLLHVLNPDDKSGIGSSTSSDGYSMGQTAIIGMKEPDDIKADSQLHMTIHEIEINGTSIEGNYINWTGATNSFFTGIVKQEEDGTYSLVGSIQSTGSMNKDTFYHYSFNMKDKLDPGTYRLSPASRLSSDKIWKPELNMQTEYILAEVTSTSIKLTYHKPTENIEVTEWNFVGTHIVGEEQEVKVTFQNKGDEYYHELHIFASPTASKGSSNCRSAVGMTENGTTTVSFFFTPTTTGTYNIWLCHGSEGNKVVASTTVDIITSAQARRAKLRFNSVSFSNGSGSTIYGNQLTGRVTIKNESSTPYQGNIRLQLWLKNTTDDVCWGSSSASLSLNIEPGATSSVPFDFQNLELGRTYFICAYYTSQNGELENGGLIWDHSFSTEPGYVYWTSSGELKGAAAKNTYIAPSGASALYVDGFKCMRITPNRQNANMVYAFGHDNEVPSTLEGHNVVQNGQADTIRIDDSEGGFYCPVEFVAQHAIFTHTIRRAAEGSKGWETLTLPFKPTRVTIDGKSIGWAGGGASLCLRELVAIGDHDELIFEDAAEARANTPYVLGSPAELVGKTLVFSADSVTFKATGEEKMLICGDLYNHYGTLVQKTVKRGYVLNEEGSAFEWTEKQTVEPLSTYITTIFSDESYDESRPSILPIGTFETGIEKIESEMRQNVQKGGCYDLQGRPVEKIQPRSIVVRNGKKIFEK